MIKKTIVNIKEREEREENKILNIGTLIVKGGGFGGGAPGELTVRRVPPPISIGGLTSGFASKISIGGETSSALTNRLILFQILRECKGDSLHEKDQTNTNVLMQLIILQTY